ncbi:uncharacterized protein LOC132193562 [Neocloeon triangulifer]|uniref:uncharacterized protein LOC132193562 n=1 Tax=Neocloeon triangulifer TaxID=2078957 RepID=UPI00286F0E7D|nr:uncharacterized protein LOC132193562 [Neocloeon triangulifer]
MNSPKITEKICRSLSRKHQSSTSSISRKGAGSDGDISSSQGSILERVKNDRVTPSRSEEDRHRRTIIVERKNGTFGFTLQSYGIHYKREQEVEVITYVDFVDYDGPAFRAGMREGDVILSINGVDMEKADHKTLVSFIKNCDLRMRMVVLFEDCVRKVELHMRYITLQRLLTERTAELERLTVKERELLAGKWKSHSLPARKKASAAAHAPTATTLLHADPWPTQSSDDLSRTAQYQYALDGGCRYLMPARAKYVPPASCSGSAEYLDWPSSNSMTSVVVAEPAGRVQATTAYEVYYRQPGGFYLVPAAHQAHLPEPIYYQLQPTNQLSGSASSSQEVLDGAERRNSGNEVQDDGSNSSKNNSCNPCVKHSKDCSTDTYDLSSPCCDPRCVSNSNSSKRKSKKNKKDENVQQNGKPPKPPKPKDLKGWREKLYRVPLVGHAVLSVTQFNPVPKKPLPTSASMPSQPLPGQQLSETCTARKYSITPASHCSLHSCASSEISSAEDTTLTSYSTSISTDTLYWDTQSHQHVQHASLKKQHQSPQQRNQPHYDQAGTPIGPPYKPKSWDNLTTKAFGGYGFGYGYSDTVNQQQAARNKAAQKAAYKSALQQQYEQQQYNMLQRLQGAPYVLQQRAPTPSSNPGAKSTENLISGSATPGGGTFESSLSCECLEAGAVGSPLQENPPSHFLNNSVQRKSIDSIFYNSQPVVSNTPPMLSRNSSIERTNESKSRPPSMVEKSEVTRL